MLTAPYIDRIRARAELIFKYDGRALRPGAATQIRNVGTMPKRDNGAWREELAVEYGLKQIARDAVTGAVTNALRFWKNGGLELVYLSAARKRTVNVKGL